MRADLISAMKMAGQNLLGGMCPEKNYAPYWEMTIDKNLRAAYNMWWPQHNLGRWWDAMLRLEAVLNVPIPAHLEAAMLSNLRDFFNNADDLCFQPVSFDGSLFQLELHSLRESLLALVALVRFRKSRWAEAQGQRMIESVRRLLKPDFSWDLEAIRTYRGETKNPDLLFDPTGTHGRLIEALVLFYDETGHAPALQLAGRLAEWHLLNTTLPDGSMNNAFVISHTHSYLGTLRGLFLYGARTNRRRFIERVALSYERTVRALVKESGYTSHDIGLEERAETTSSGDAAQLALWLALDGDERLFDDVERLVKARILPSQITRVEPLTPASDEPSDRFFNLAERAVGGFGGMHKHPHGGKMNTTDITAADLHSLLDIYQAVVTERPHCVHVNMHLDYLGESIQISSALGRLCIAYRGAKPLHVRMPAYIPRASVTVSINARPSAPIWRGESLCFDRPSGVSSLSIGFEAPARTTIEETDGVAFAIRWRGNEVASIAPNAGYLPFYSTQGP